MHMADGRWTNGPNAQAWMKRYGERGAITVLCLWAIYRTKGTRRFNSTVFNCFISNDRVFPYYFFMLRSRATHRRVHNCCWPFRRCVCVFFFPSDPTHAQWEAGRVRRYLFAFESVIHRLFNYKRNAFDSLHSYIWYASSANSFLLAIVSPYRDGTS